MIQTNLKSRWWTGPAWRLYRHLTAAVNDALRWHYPYVLPLKSLHIPITILRGPTCIDGHQGTMIVAGDEHKIDFLISRFFKGEHRRETMGKVALWNLNRTLKRLHTSADLTIAYVDQLSARLFFGPDYLTVPEWTGLTLTVPEDTSELTQSSRSLKEDLRVVRRNKLTADFTQATADFEFFYHTMYIPFMVKRHGKQAIVRDIEQLRRRFHQGGLLWVRQNDQPIAGAIFQRRDQVLRLLVVGTTNGEWAPVKAGALAALYLFVLKHAKERGCKLVDIGGSRPSLNDGLLRYKLKWGAKLTENIEIHYDFLVHWNRLSRPVISFLSNTPLIFRDQSGLSAMYVIYQDEPATETEAESIYRSMWIPGLQRLYLAATSGWQTVQDSPLETVLIDLADRRDCNPRTPQVPGSK